MLRRAKDREHDGHRSDASGLVVGGDDPDALELMGRILAAIGEPIELIDDKASTIATVVGGARKGVVVAFRGGHSGNLAVVDTIRRHGDPGVRATPVVVIAEDEKQASATWQAGADDLLVWPVHADDLLASVRAAVTRSSAEREDHRRTGLRRAQAAALADPDQF